MISPIGKKKRRSNVGFTLIELVLVVLLISILIGLSTPLFKGTFQDLQLKNSTFNVIKIINYAEEMAIIEKTNHKLNFDPEKGKFWITKRVLSGEGFLYKRIGGRYGRAFCLPEGLKFTSEDNEIIFYPDGRTGGAEITITGEKGSGRCLRVKGFGSRLEVEEISGE